MAWKNPAKNSREIKVKRKTLFAFAAMGAVGLLLADPAAAQEAAELTDEQIADQYDRTNPSTAMNMVVLDNVYIFLSGVLVFLMQPGFALVEAGLTRAKNAANIMMKNMVDVSIGVLMFALIGYSIAYPGEFGGYLGFAGFGVEGLVSGGLVDISPEALADDGFYPLAIPVDFFFQAAFAATAATIVSGAVAGRTKFIGYLLYSVVLTGLIYPIVVSWKWGLGFLDSLDTGFVDFAGSGLVHMTGGFAALMGAIIIGPRVGKFKDGKPQAMPGHSIPMAITGVLILFIGWFGFNPGSQLQADMDVPVLAVLTAFAAASGGIFALVTSWLTMGKPDVSMTGNGILAGLVAICSGIGEFNAVGTLVTGAVAGIIVVISVLFIERLGIDDPVGAFSVHGICGVWGLIATGLFATAARGDVTGVFYGGGASSLVSQLIGVVSIAVFVTVTAGALFFVLKAAGFLRVDIEEEVAGLDVSEHGTPGYGPADSLVSVG